MAESSEILERRKHQRTPVSSGVIAVLITSCPEIIGSVSDISLGGAGNVVGASEDAAVDQDPGSDPGADSHVDGVPAPLRGSLPGLTQDVAGPVAVDDDTLGRHVDGLGQL